MSRLIFILVALALGFAAQAQGYLKERSKNYLRHTAQIIRHVHTEIPKLDSTQKSGKFAMAVAHQRLARNQFEVKNYQASISHSIFARELAQEVYGMNNRILPLFFKDMDDEVTLKSYRLPTKELDKSLLKAYPGTRFNDNDFAIYEKLTKIDADDLP